MIYFEESCLRVCVGRAPNSKRPVTLHMYSVPKYCYLEACLYISCPPTGVSQSNVRSKFKAPKRSSDSGPGLKQLNLLSHVAQFAYSTHRSAPSAHLHSIHTTCMCMCLKCMCLNGRLVYILFPIAAMYMCIFLFSRPQMTREQ